MNPDELKPEDEIKANFTVESDTDAENNPDSESPLSEEEQVEQPAKKEGFFARAEKFLEKSTLGKKLIGQEVGPEDKASGTEKAALITSKIGGITSSMFGLNLLTRLPDRTLKRIYSKREIARIKGALIEETKLKKELKKEKVSEKRKSEIETRLQEMGVAETEPDQGEERINKHMAEIEKRLNESKYLSEEKKAQLKEKLAAIQGDWTANSEKAEDDMAMEVDSILNQHVGQRMKKKDLLKESFDMAAVASGAYAIRAVGRAAFGLYDRYRNVKDGKKEGEKVKFLKEVIYNGAKETAQEMAGGGRIKELKGKQKAIAWTSAWGKAMVPVAIAIMGYSEVAEKGGGAFTKALERMQERAGEIGEAWDKVGEAGALAKPGEAIRALLDTMNLRESASRLSFGLVDKEGAAAGASLETPDLQTPEPTANVGHIEGGTESIMEPNSFDIDTDHYQTPGQEAGAAMPDSQFVNMKDQLQAIGVTDSTAQADLMETFKGQGELLKEAGATFDAAGLTPEQSAELIQHSTPEALHETIEQLKAESILGVNSIEGGLTEQEINSVAAQLRGPNSETANALFDKWEAKGVLPSDQVASLRDQVALEELIGIDSFKEEITPDELDKISAALHGEKAEEVNALLDKFQGKGMISEESVGDVRGLVEAEKALGVNSFEEGISPEELQKTLAGLATENKEQADALLANWQERELVDPTEVAKLRFPIEHASLEHAGFQTEVAEGKVNLALDLGKEGVPKHLEQVYYRMAIENTELGDKITNLEGAHVLNVGANLRELTEGHNIAGVSAEDFQKYVNVEDGKITISDYEGFKANVLDKLTEHSQEIITEDNVGNSGAVAYLDNIRKATWTDMVQPEGIPQEGVQFDQGMIDKAEGRLFQATLDKSGMGELASDIEFTNEDTGTFEFFGENVSVKNGEVISIGDTQLEQPFALGNKDGGIKLVDEAAKVSMENRIAEIKPRLVEIDAAPIEYDVSPELDDTLHDLGFGKGQGVAEWEFLKEQSVDDLLNKDIEGHAGKQYDWWEGRHRGKLRNFLQEAIDDGKIKSPADGGPETVGDAVHETLVADVKADFEAEVASAENIVGSAEKISEEGAKALDALEKDVSQLVQVGDHGRGTLSLSLEQIRSDEGREILKSAIEADGGNVDRVDEIRKEIINTLNNSEGVDYKQNLAHFLGNHTDNDIVKSAVTGFRPETVSGIEAAGIEEAAGTPEAVVEESGPVVANELPEGVKVNATPAAEQFMKEHGLKFENGKLVGLQGKNMTFAAQPGMEDQGVTESISLDKMDNGNLRVNVIDTDGSQDVLEITPEGTPVNVQGVETISAVAEQKPESGAIAYDDYKKVMTSEPGTEFTFENGKMVDVETPAGMEVAGAANPEEVKLALDNLAGGIEGIDKLSVEDIKQLDDVITLTKLKDGAEDVLKQLPELIKNPPEGTDADSLQQVARGYKTVLETINGRLKEIQG